MKAMLVVSALGVLFAALLLACPPTPPVPAVTMVDADGAAIPVTPASACANLAQLGCGVATDAGSCIAGLTNMSKAGLAPLDLFCISTAPSKSAVIRCAGVGLTGCGSP